MGTGYFVSITIDVALAMLLPVVAAAAVSRKFTRVGVVLAGAAVFTLFQLMLRLPLLQIIQSVFPQLVPSAGINMHFIVYSAVLALTAGIFEEFGRYLGLVTVLKKYRSWGDGIGYGIGHGGIEAIIFVGLPCISGYFTNIAAPGQPLWQISFGGVERLFTMIIHIGFSLLVMYAVYSKQFKYVILAVVLHMFVDFPAGFATATGSFLLIEGYVAVCALASLIWIIRSRKLFSSTC